MLFQKWSTRSAPRLKSTLTEESDEVATSSWLSPSEPGQSESVALFSGPSQREERQGSQGCFLYSRQISPRSWPSQVDELYQKLTKASSRIQCNIPALPRGGAMQG